MGLQRFQGQVNFFVFLRETKWFTKLQYQVAIHLGAVQKLRSVNFYRLSPHPPVVVQPQCFSFTPPPTPNTTQCFASFFSSFFHVFATCLDFFPGFLATSQPRCAVIDSFISSLESLYLKLLTLRLKEVKEGGKKVCLLKKKEKCKNVKRTHQPKHKKKIRT